MYSIYMDLAEKINILAFAAKYDASCASFLQAVKEGLPGREKADWGIECRPELATVGQETAAVLAF